MSSAKAVVFSIPKVSSRWIRRGPKHMLKIHREIMLPWEVPLLDLKERSPVLIVFWE